MEYCDLINYQKRGIGILVTEYGHIDINHCNIQNWRSGIGAYNDGASLIVRNSQIVHNVNEGILIENCQSAKIENNTINQNNTGIYLRYIRKVEIMNNVISENDLGVYAGNWYSYGLEFQQNEVTQNIVGIQVYFPKSCYFGYNTIADNEKYSIKMDEENNAYFSNNYWGTTNEEEIDASIYDFYDDFDLGKVQYEPFLTQPFNQGQVVASHNSGTYFEPISVTLSGIGETYEIYYTIDGQDPRNHGVLYTGKPLLLQSDTTLRCVIKIEESWGEIQQFDYIFQIIPENAAYTISAVRAYGLNELPVSGIPDGDFYLRASIQKHVSGQEAVIFVAAYNDENQLVLCNLDTQSLQGVFAGEMITYTKKITSGQIPIDKIRIFIWDISDGMIPISNIGKL